MTKTRAIRVSEQEEKLIQEFLKKNPFLDFSTLARLAIRRFIENPHLEVRGIKSNSKKMEAHI